MPREMRREEPSEPETVQVPLRGSAAAACAQCADRLVEGVCALPGVETARLDAPSATLTVVLDPGQAEAAGRLARDAETLANRLSEQFGHRTYRVGGMDCADCARSIEKSVGALPGVLSADVNFPAAKLRVEYTPGTRGVEEIGARTRALGFTLEPAEPTAATALPGAEDGRSSPRRRVSRSTLRVALSGALLLLGLVLEHGLRAPAFWVNAAFAGSVGVGGWRFALAGVQALRARVVGTNLLMALAAAGAVALGHWGEAAAVVFLYTLGEALEGAAMERTRGSLRALLDAAPARAILLAGDGSEATVAASALTPGDRILVRPGDRFAADGVVVSGRSSVSEAAITGESLPREKANGDAVFAGSVNGNGALTVRVTAPASDSTLARILHLVEEAQAQKAPAQALVERFGRVYTPLVIVAAASLALIGPWLAPGADWTYRALTLLVVACPCALVIATPVAYVSGIARAARGGVLVKGGAYLEALAGVRHVALDKTGTLTAGAPAVVAVRAAAGVGEDELLAVAAAVERQSEHPLAAAVVAEARRRGVPIPGATAAAAVPGRGVTGTVDGSDVLVGNASLLAERDVAVPPRLRDEADEMAGAGKTPLLVARGGRALGLIAVADPLRPEAPEAIALLRRLGASPSILTGDQDAVARAVAREAGIDDVRAGLLPEDKLDAVRVLRASDPNRVAFVGDGINDAPALAAATVGIAIGAGGTAAALEAADVALMTGDLSRLPWTIRLARATRAVVRQNILVSMAVVAALLATTVTGLLSLPLGVLGHEGSALLVILNGLRLLSPRLTRL